MLNTLRYLRLGYSFKELVLGGFDYMLNTLRYLRLGYYRLIPDCSPPHTYAQHLTVSKVRVLFTKVLLDIYQNNAQHLTVSKVRVLLFGTFCQHHGIMLNTLRYLRLGYC